MEPQASCDDVRNQAISQKVSTIQRLQEMQCRANQISETLFPILKALAEPVTYPPYIQQLSEILGILTKMASTSYAAELNVILSRINEVMSIFGEAANREDISSEDAPVEIPAGTLEAFQEIAPLVPENKREEFERITAPEKERKILTIENVKWLLGVIIPILFSIYLQQLPDKNAEEHNQLHREANDIGRDIAEALEPYSEEEMVEKFLEYLDNNGFVLMQKDEVIYEQPDGPPNCMGIIEEDVDALDDSALSGLETDDCSDQPSSQNSQD